MDDPTKIAARFALAGKPLSAHRLGRGHINDTWRVTVDRSAERYVLQRLNSRVFPDPIAVMENVKIVTEHLKAHSHMPAGLALVPARTGRFFVIDTAQNVWRTYQYIENSYTINTAETTQQAYGAARLFRQFLENVSTLEPRKLRETLPNFHDLNARLCALDQAIEHADSKRLDLAVSELKYIDARRGWADILPALVKSGEIKKRVTHNDCKINNVLFDRETHKPLCVVDLDTVMPSLALYDFGDLVRSATATAPEDEANLSLVRFRMENFRAIAKAYLETPNTALTDTECAYLPFACRYITFMLGVRFLTDYLAGDIYFKTCRPDQNLHRNRVQLRMTELMERRETEMSLAIAGILKEHGESSPEKLF